MRNLLEIFSSIVIEVIKDNLKPLYFFFTRNVYTHRKQKVHTSEQKQKNKIFTRLKTSKRKKVATFKLPLITSITILLITILLIITVKIFHHNHNNHNNHNNYNNHNNHNKHNNHHNSHHNNHHNYHNIFLLLQSFLIITIFFHDHNIF